MEEKAVGSINGPDRHTCRVGHEFIETTSWTRNHLNDDADRENILLK